MNRHILTASAIALLTSLNSGAMQQKARNEYRVIQEIITCYLQIDQHKNKLQHYESILDIGKDSLRALAKHVPHEPLYVYPVVSFTMASVALCFVKYHNESLEIIEQEKNLQSLFKELKMLQKTSAPNSKL